MSLNLPRGGSIFPDFDVQRILSARLTAALQAPGGIFTSVYLAQTAPQRVEGSCIGAFGAQAETGSINNSTNILGKRGSTEEAQSTILAGLCPGVNASTL